MIKKKSVEEGGVRNLIILHRALEYVVAFLAKLGNQELNMFFVNVTRSIPVP